jgi:hypothetical protein
MLNAPAERPSRIGARYQFDIEAIFQPPRGVWHRCWRPSNPDGEQQESQMSKLKIALIVGGIAVALSSAAQAFEARIGNGSSWVTINPAASVEARQPLTQAPNLPFSRYGNGHN